MSHILLVDEDQDHSTLLANRLRAESLQVVTCPRWDAAVRVLTGTSDPFELVVLNLSLSPQKGLECVRAICHLRWNPNCFLGPRVICAVDHLLDPHLELEIEALGARVVYEG